MNDQPLTEADVATIWTQRCSEDAHENLRRLIADWERLQKADGQLRAAWSASIEEAAALRSLTGELVGIALKLRCLVKPYGLSDQGGELSDWEIWKAAKDQLDAALARAAEMGVE